MEEIKSLPKTRPMVLAGSLLSLINIFTAFFAVDIFGDEAGFAFFIFFPIILIYGLLMMVVNRKILNSIKSFIIGISICLLANVIIILAISIFLN